MQDFNSLLQTIVNLKISIVQVRVLRKSCLLSFANILFRISLDMVFCGEKKTYKGKTQEELLTPVNFVYSEKATKFCEISTLLLTTVHTVKS